MFEETYKMKFTMTKIAAAAVLAFAASSAYAIDEAPDGGIGNVVDFNVTSGTFAMADPTQQIAFGALNWDMVDAGGATGSQAALFQFFFKPVNVFTNTPLATDNTPFGGVAVPGGNFVTGTTTASTITMDLSSWTNNWGTPPGTNFNTGADPVTGTYDSMTGAFSMSWSTVIQGGSFDGNEAFWTFNGVAAAAPVPEASTYGMMLAGLGLVGFAVRRRKLMA